MSDKTLAQKILELKDKGENIPQELLREAEEEVLFPTPTEYILKLRTLGEKTVKLEPMPILFSKKINKALEKSNKKMAAMGKRVGGAIVERIDADGTKEQYIDRAKLTAMMTDEDLMLDLEVAEGILETAVILCEFYNLGMDKEQVNSEMTLPVAMEFADKQIYIQGDNDFLLKPLSSILDLLKSLPIASKLDTLGQML